MDVIVRPVEKQDIEDLNIMRRLPGVFETILAMPSERITFNEGFVDHLDSYAHSFVAVIVDEQGTEKKVIGNASLHVSPKHRMRHSAGIGIMVHTDFQGRGVGTKLLETLVDLADNWLKLVRIELTVFADHEKAVNFYKKFGFEIEGTKKNAAIRNGQYVDELMMARIKM